MVLPVTWKDVNASGNALLNPAVITTNGSNLVFTSGALGTDAAGAIPDGVTQQTELACANLIKTLEAAGSNPSKILKVLLFVSHPSYGPAVNKVYAKHFPGAPGRSCIVVAFPNPAVKVELECIAESDPKAVKAKL